MQHCSNFLIPVCSLFGLATAMWIAFSPGSIWLAEAALLGIMAIGFVPIAFGSVKGSRKARSTYQRIIAPYEALGVNYVESGEAKEVIAYTRKKTLRTFLAYLLKMPKLIKRFHLSYSRSYLPNAYGKAI